MRRAYDSYRDLNTVPFGVNSDDLESHQKFREHLKLQFHLLVDEGLRVARDYGALKPDPKRPGEFLDSVLRTVVIVGKDGSVIYRANGIPSTEDLLNTIRHAADD